MHKPMLKSIRWTLQIWHASLLAIVLIGFGTASYYGISRMRYQEIDADLEKTAQVLAATIGPRGPRFDGPPPEGRGFDGRGFDGREFDGRGPASQPGDQPDEEREWRGGRGRGRGGPRGDRGDRGRGGPPDIEVPPSMAHRFGDINTDGLYFIGWGMFNEVLRTSVSPEAAESIPRPTPLDEFSRSAPPGIRQRGNFREAYVYGPLTTRVVVGRSVVHEQAAMRNLALLLVLIGAVVLVVGLAGGWMVAHRAVRPIEAITEAAQHISASNLSRRIDVGGTHSELGNLATVLNDMFGRLDASFQQQVRFTADASHELRTPLSVIHTHAQLALSKDRSAEEYRNTINTCLRASTRMKELVDSLLLLAGADAGSLKIDRQPFALHEAVEECVAMVTPLAAEKKVTVESDLSPVELKADRSRISQVVMNLLSNAIRYNREGGSVRVSVKADGNDAIISIADTGMGIPPEHLPHLFERFYRVDVARSREVGGSGLGLSICKSIVDAHQGQISVTSQAEKGTVFTVRLPR